MLDFLFLDHLGILQRTISNSYINDNDNNNDDIKDNKLNNSNDNDFIIDNVIVVVVIAVADVVVKHLELLLVVYQVRYVLLVVTYR